MKPLSEETLTNLAEKSAVEKHARRSIVLSAGKREESICLLFEGRLQGVDFTIDGREVGLYFVENGGFCGELALFDEEPQAEFVIAVTSSTVIMVPVMELREVMMDAPKVMGMLGSKLAARVREMSLQRSLLGLPNVGQRVCQQLWLLIESRDQKRAVATDQPKELEIRNPPTHREIAIMLNLSRETVTRVFQSLQSRKIVRRDGPSRLIFTEPETLRQLAEGSINI